MECTREWDNSHTTIHLVELGNTQPGWMHVTHRRLLLLALENGLRWLRITSRSQPCPVLATAKIYPILARSRKSTLRIWHRALGAVPGRADTRDWQTLETPQFSLFCEWKNTCPTPPNVFFTGNPPCFDSFSDILLHLGEAVGQPEALCEALHLQGRQEGWAVAAVLPWLHHTSSRTPGSPSLPIHSPLACPPHPTGMHRGATTLHSLVALTPQC